MKYFKKIILFIILVLVVIILAGMYKFNYLANQPGYNVDGNKIESNTNKDVSEDEIIEKRSPSRYVCVGEFCDGSGIGEDIEMTVLNIPLIKDGGSIGCGADLFFAPHGILKTITPLDETYIMMFDLKPLPEIVEDGFRNPLGSYTQLFYEKVTLDDRLAKVYLKGNLYGPGHCSLPEIREQIVQAALHFDTVDGVEVYLNNSIYDWCEMDESDGEGSCPEVPDLWVDVK